MTVKKVIALTITTDVYFNDLNIIYYYASESDLDSDSKTQFKLVPNFSPLSQKVIHYYNNTIIIIILLSSFLLHLLRILQIILNPIVIIILYYHYTTFSLSLSLCICVLYK